ncbi:MAG: Gfo/Idh/MocA family protein [Thermomicrobiales bacterium]
MELAADKQGPEQPLRAPVRFAIIGAGNIAGVHARAMADLTDARVAVVCARSEDAGRALAAQCGADWTPEYHEAVSRPDVDAVCVCTPSGAHGEVAIAAARAGKHILVEKPLEITLDRIDAVIAAADEAVVKLGCVLPSRFMRGVALAKAAIQDGRLGKITLATASVPWYRSQAYYDTGGWRGTWALDGGGALMNQSIHTIDLLQWFVGPVDRVSGEVATLSHRMETEDTAAAILSLRSGGIGVVRAGTGCWPGDRSRIDRHGDRGTISLEDGRIVVWRLMDAAPGEEVQMIGLEAPPGSGAQDPMGITADRHRALIADLIDAIYDDRSPAVSGDDSRHAVEIIRAIYASSRHGRLVALPLAEEALGLRR